MSGIGYLQVIERALWTAAKAELPARSLAGKALANAICERSERYTRDREHLTEQPRGRGDDDLAARALFFSVADAAKIRVPLAELNNAGVLPSARSLRVADLGAGPGAMSLGMLSLLATEVDGIDLLAVDRDRAALQILHGALAALPSGWRDSLTLHTECEDVRGWKPASSGIDLVLAGTLLNELSAGDAFALVRSWLGWLSDDGAIVIIEPALRETSRALHTLRDRIIGDQLGHVFAPCTRRAAPCPALADDRDWCHEDRPVNLPERASQLVRTTGLRSHGLKFSYLVIRKQADRLADDDGDRAALRVVSRPRKLKGRLECFVCGEQCGRLALRLLKRNRSSGNQALGLARRGDVILAVPRKDVVAADRIDVLTPSAVD